MTRVTSEEAKFYLITHGGSLTSRFRRLNNSSYLIPIDSKDTLQEYKVSLRQTQHILGSKYIRNYLT